MHERLAVAESLGTPPLAGIVVVVDVTRRPAETIAIEFTRDVADYVESREWHKSQQIEERTDGSIVLHLEVSNDQPLRSWILSFGSHARVLAPASLADGIRGELERAHEVYHGDVRLDRAS